MRYRVTVERPASSENSRRGGKTEFEQVHCGPQDSDGKVWAAIQQQRVATQNPTGKKTAVIGSYEIRVWSINDIDETWRFTHGDLVYNIVSIDRPNPNSRELVIIAKRDKLKEV
jgi:head-tail adaptor